MTTPPIVSRQEWEAARQQLLVREKKLTRARDALAAERRRMPWLAVDKASAFDGPDGRVSLLELFDITALGRQEEWEDSPEGYPQTPPYGWWNYHHAYSEGK
jgi:predicted dithiol-disulfide oxidoreductase (DUF899 family)